MHDRRRRVEGFALDRVPTSNLQLPTVVSGRALTREQEHVARQLGLQLAQIAGTAAKTAYAEELVERLGAATYASGMRAAQAILSQQQGLMSEELQRYAAVYAEQLIAQTLQHLGAIAAIGGRRIAEIVDQPFDPPPARRWLERLWED